MTHAPTSVTAIIVLKQRCLHPSPQVGYIEFGASVSCPIAGPKGSRAPLRTAASQLQETGAELKQKVVTMFQEIRETLHESGFT